MKILPESLSKLIRRPVGRLNPFFWVISAIIVFSLIPIVFMIAFFAFEFYQFKVNETKAQKTQVELENEFRAIQPLPQANLAGYHAFHKPNTALAEGEYQTKLTYSEIRAYYDSELVKHGWKFQREENVIYRGQNTGGKEAFYSKGQYTASIQYAGQLEQADFGWNYTLGLSWDSGD